MDIDPDDLPTGFLLNTAARLILEETDRRLAGAPINVIELGVLWLVETAPKRLQSDYARFQHRDVTTFGRYVDKLESKGLIERLAVPGDRRARALALTAAGVDVLAEYKRHALDAEAAVFGGSPKELSDLRRLLLVHLTQSSAMLS